MTNLFGRHVVAKSGQPAAPVLLASPVLFGLALLALGLGAVAPLAAQTAPSCTAIHFETGHTSATVRGMAPADNVACYTVATAKDQVAEFKIVGGDNSVFTIDGLVDARTSYTFKTERRTYRILVGQMARAVAPEAFTLSVAIK